MTEAILDPNVLVAAALNPGGAPAVCLRAHAEGRFDLIVSERLLAELESVLARTKFRAYLSRDEAARFVAALRRVAEIRPDPESAPSVAPRDPDDGYLVALAESERAHVLVSGDRHLLELSHPQLRILAPRSFLERLPR